MRGPREVCFEERGPALELVELACGDEVADVFPGVRGEFGVGDAELVPVDGGEGKRRVVAGKGEGGGVRVGGPCCLEGFGLRFYVYCVWRHFGRIDTGWICGRDGNASGFSCGGEKRNRDIWV